jgi:mycothiol synthase
VTAPQVTITESRLAPVTAQGVLDLARTAQAVDGVAPLSEDALYNARTRPAGVRELVLTRPGGTLAGYAQLGPPEADPHSGSLEEDRSGELVIHPDYRRQGLGSALVTALTDDGTGTYGLRLWAHGDLPAAAALAKSAGFTRVRSLWQMRMTLTNAALPEVALPAGLTLRTFRPGQDEAAWLEVNGRAFAHHPEQGSWTREDLALREAEPWFDADGFFLGLRDGQLAGFHWTKVHPDGGAGGAPIGEVYVVGVDPGQQGGGLGRGLTVAGLAHLQQAGLAEVMLYVDEDNAAAVRMYTALGFSRWSTDVMYRHP